VTVHFRGTPEASAALTNVAGMRSSGRDLTDLSRSVGGVLLAVGAVVVLTRKSGEGQLSDLARVLITGAPAILLYTLAVGAIERDRINDGEPWRAILLVTSILLATVALFELLRWIGADTANALWSAGVFVASGLLAGYGAQRATVPYGALLAGLAALSAWLLTCAKILGDPSTDTVRWLLVAGGGLLFLAAGAIARRDALGAPELAIAGGIAAVAAGVLGVFVGYFVGIFRGFVDSGRSLSHSGPSHRAFEFPGIAHASGLQSFGWDLYLLLVSLGLVWVGSRVRARGLGYVGAAGLVAFAISVGAQITRLESGHTPSGSLAGWPLALVGVGAVALIAPAVYRRD
jgi:hypothetical protein